MVLPSCLYGHEGLAASPGTKRGRRSLAKASQGDSLCCLHSASAWPSFLHEGEVAMDNHPVLLGLAIAVIAPLLAEIPIGFRLPAVVLEMVLGIIVGPQVLHLSKPDGLIAWVGGTLGVGAMFFMAGLDLDLQ